jgi:hypothetical protein
VYALHLHGTSEQTHLTALLISPKAKKNFEVLFCKRPFFSTGKKGRGLTTAPPPHPYFREKCSEGGAIRWGCSDVLRVFLFFCTTHDMMPQHVYYVDFGYIYVNNRRG